MSNEELMKEYLATNNADIRKEIAQTLYLRNQGLLSDIAKKQARKFNCLFTEENHACLSDYSLMILEELEMEAATAFVELLDSGEYNGSTKLTTYMYPHIQFCLRRWLEENIGNIALKKDESQFIRTVQRLYHADQMTESEIAEKLNLPLPEISKHLTCGTHALYVNDLVPEDGEAYTDPYDYVTTEYLSEDVDFTVYYKLCLEYLTPLFESLPEYDRGIVGHYLGAFGYRKKPVEEIAKELCMTSDGVIKSYKAIVRKMREKYPDSMFHIWRRAHAAVQRATGR